MFDALTEFIKLENHYISGPANDAKKKLEELAKENSTTKMSGYESQFKVNFNSMFSYTVAIMILN